MIGASSVAPISISISLPRCGRIPELLDVVVGVGQHSVVGVETRQHVFGRGEVDVDVFDLQTRQRIAHDSTGAIGDGDVERVVAELERHDPQLASHFFADIRERLGRRANGTQIDGRQSELRSERPSELTGVEQALFDEDGAQLTAGLLLQIERFRKLFR